eukprot:TRINITY_DN1860_c0_g1_i5.p1 TRINITY_DN1860_c0_g1~~TRINITY_DN1860_c0_g1_i5.p1  ORF type:complete len:258 (-),score=58.07 TRINITY_DN1860_c0_g1_i5:83-856(-)
MVYPQPSYNLFLHDYTNHPVAQALSNQTKEERDLMALYTKSTKYPTMTGLSKFAQVDRNGREEPAPNFPFRIIFHPVDNLHYGFPDAAPKSPNPWYHYLLLLNPGPLFEVYAQREPSDQDMTERYIRIGTISTTRKFIPGKFGDTKLSFEHTYMERDFEFFPVREMAAKDIIKQQQENMNYRYKDLPWGNATDLIVPEEGPEEAEEVDTTPLGVVDIILIVFICLAFIVLVVVLAAIVRGYFFDGATTSSLGDYELH